MDAESDIEKRDNVRIIVLSWHNGTTTTESEMKEKPVDFQVENGQKGWTGENEGMLLDKPSPDWLMYQKLLTTWNMTLSLDWHHIFPAISLRSWERGNEETRLIVMKYRALWVTALGRLSLPANAFYTTSWLKLDFEYQSFPKSMSSFFSFSLHGTVSHNWIFSFHKNIKRMTEDFWMSEYNWCALSVQWIHY